MYGVNKIPLDLQRESLSLSVNKNADRMEYFRECLGSKTQKLILSKQDEILICPVEPLNLPRQVATFLMVEFLREMMMQPDSKSVIYLTFPLEIGVFVGKKDKYEILDIFSLARAKYSLYGEPRNGVICKYWQSPVFLEEPQTNPLIEGIIQLNLINSSKNWVQVNKVLFNGNGMKIYYNNKNTSMKATMKILEEEAAEVEFNNSPLHRDMKKSPELFSTRRLSASARKAVMLEGI